MIDLHAHTNESDGSLSPGELIALASVIGLEAVAVTDHDTFAGFDQAVLAARDAEVEVICGIEMSTKYRGCSVHLLGYFLNGGAPEDFRYWILELQRSRQERNSRLLERLRGEGIEITPLELVASSRGLPGRPHVARLMLEKGYVTTLQQAFDLYLDESACCYVAREEPSFAESVQRINSAGGISCLAHPGRVSRDSAEISDTVYAMRDLGLLAIECWYSKHSSAETALYIDLAERLGMAVTGGSDFHGAPKPDIELGSGLNNNLCIPYSVLDRLRALV